jgi:hypothetical protein
MVRRFLLFAAICALAIKSEPVSANPPSADEQAVLKVDSDWADAEERRDKAALDRVLADQFIATFGTDKPVDKPTFIKSILSEDPAVSDTQKLSDRSVVVDSDTAVVVEVDTETTIKNTKKRVASWRFTVTYIKRRGSWIALAEQGGPARP